MKEYKYPAITFDRLKTRSGLVMLLLVMPLILGLGWVLSGQFLTGLGWALFAGVLVCLAVYAFNLRPAVTCDPERLSVDFMGMPCQIAWADILGIRQVYGLPRKAWLVQAPNISPLHHFYGLQFGKSWTPGFLIWEDISERTELLAEIRKQIKALR